MIAIFLLVALSAAAANSIFSQKVLRELPTASFSGEKKETTNLVDITGAWRNDLGSYLYVYMQDSNGNFIGEYNSAVGNVSGNFTAFGSINSEAAQFATVFFGVNWHPQVEACTAWSGVVDGDFITATWLLSTSVNATGDLWSSTRVGQDVFVREY